MVFMQGIIARICLCQSCQRLRLTSSTWYVRLLLLLRTGLPDCLIKGSCSLGCRCRMTYAAQQRVRRSVSGECQERVKRRSRDVAIAGYLCNSGTLTGDSKRHRAGCSSSFCYFLCVVGIRYTKLFNAALVTETTCSLSIPISIDGNVRTHQVEACAAKLGIFHQWVGARCKKFVTCEATPCPFNQATAQHNFQISTRRMTRMHWCTTLKITHYKISSS
jgi:hypothetical protein